MTTRIYRGRKPLETLLPKALSVRPRISEPHPKPDASMVDDPPSARNAYQGASLTVAQARRVRKRINKRKGHEDGV